MSAALEIREACSLAMSRYYPSYIRDNPHLSLDSLLSSSLRPTFYNNQIVDKASVLPAKPTPYSKYRLLYHLIVDDTLEWCTSRSNSFNADNNLIARWFFLLDWIRIIGSHPIIFASISTSTNFILWWWFDILNSWWSGRGAPCWV